MHNIEQARKAFWKQASAVWYVQELSLDVKMLVFRAGMPSVLLYGCDTWTTTFTARHKLRLFYMTCLRVISRVTHWQQQNWHLSNDTLRGWLGPPDIIALITQHQLHWIGHVARMPQDRSPRQIICAFLPESIGTQHLPGRLKGKWYCQTLVEAMRVAEIPLALWTQFAIRNNGDDWRLATRKVALRYRPMHPRPNADIPNKKAELGKILKKRTAHPDRIFASAVHRANDRITAQATEASGFLNLRTSMRQYHYRLCLFGRTSPLPGG